MRTCNQDQDTAHVATTCNPHVTNAAGGSADVQSKFRRCVHTSQKAPSQPSEGLDLWMGIRLDPAKGYFAGEPAKQGTATTTNHCVPLRR